MPIEILAVVLEASGPIAAGGGALRSEPHFLRSRVRPFAWTDAVRKKCRVSASLGRERFAEKGAGPGCSILDV
ncbi:MAG: hypothetical protein HYY14_06485 [Candidatus Omnitrophica bacterium]|nr:hypothetical protein [Candidatus Omnitrophota bacterium]